MRSLLLLTLLGACGTSDTAATVLRCADFAYCATYEINKNNGGTVDRPERVNAFETAGLGIL